MHCGWPSRKISLPRACTLLARSKLQLRAANVEAKSLAAAGNVVGRAAAQPLLLAIGHARPAAADR